MNGVHREAHNHLSLSTQTFLFLLQPLLPDHPPSLSPSSFFTSVFHPCFHNPSLSIRTCAPLSGLTLSQCFCFFFYPSSISVFFYTLSITSYFLSPVSRLLPSNITHSIPPVTWWNLRGMKVCSTVLRVCWINQRTKLRPKTRFKRQSPEHEFAAPG